MSRPAWHVAALLVVAGCETNAKGDYFENQIRDSLVEKLGPVAEIACPERIRLENQGTVFDCEVRLTNGNSGTIEVRFERDGQLGWQTK